MTLQNKARLENLLQTFSSGIVIHEFHREWQLFMDTLSKNDRTIATRAMMNATLENAKSFRQEAIEFAENGSSEDRQSVLDMVDDLAKHPLFVRKSVGV